MSVRLSLKISVTTKPIGFYSSGNIPDGPVVVLGYFLGGLDTIIPPPNKNIPTSIFFADACNKNIDAAQPLFLL